MKTHIHFRTFFMRQKLKNPDSDFGHYCFTAPEGEGKTYMAVRYMMENVHLFDTIWSNTPLDDVYFASYGVVVHYYDSMYDLIDINPYRACILFDDIFSLIDPTRRVSQSFLDFIYRSRRNRRIVLTTAQSWLELPIGFRRSVRCNFALRKFFKKFLYVVVGDAKNMVYDNLIGEYVCPLIAKHILKQVDFVMTKYSTHQNSTIDIKSLTKSSKFDKTTFQKR